MCARVFCVYLLDLPTISYCISIALCIYIYAREKAKEKPNKTEETIRHRTPPFAIIFCFSYKERISMGKYYALEKGNNFNLIYNILIWLVIVGKICERRVLFRLLLPTAITLNAWVGALPLCCFKFDISNNFSSYCLRIYLYLCV